MRAGRVVTLGTLRPARPFRLYAVIGVTFVIMFGYGLVVPTLPLLASSLGVKEAGVGLLLTAFAGARLGASLFTGSVLRRLGERPVASIGAAIVGISSLSAGFAPTFHWLVVLRGFGGVGSAFFLGAVTSALLGGVPADRRGRAMALFQASVVTGFILGPMFGGLLGRISLRAPLYGYGAICLAAAPFLGLFMGDPARRATLDVAMDLPGQAEENPPPPRIPTWRRLRPLFKDSAFRGALAMGWTTFFVAGGFDTLASRTWRFTLMQSPATVGIPFLANGLAGLLPTLHAGRLADKRGRKFSTVPALAISIPLIVALGLARGPVAFVVLTGLLGAAWAYQRPGSTAMIGDVTDDSTRAIAIGALRISNDLGALIGPILVGVVAQSISRSAGYIVTAGAVVVGLVFMVLARETAPPQLQR